MSDTFKKAWARKVKEGYKFPWTSRSSERQEVDGEDALEQVRFGFELTEEERAREASMESARERLSKSLLGIYHLMWTGSVPNIVKAVEDLIDAKLRERGL